MPDVGNRVVRQVVHAEPPQVIALVGLHVRDLARPRGRLQEEGDVLLVPLEVHRSHNFQVGGRDLDVGFLSRLAGHSPRELLTSLDVARDHAVVPVLVSRVVSPEKKHSPFPDEE